jgi:hypothetical protein
MGAEALEGMSAPKEAVNHPSHYGGDVPHEVWKCLQAWGLTADAYRWNAAKYIARAGLKDPTKIVEDLEKARWYLDRAIETEKERRNAKA